MVFQRIISRFPGRIKISGQPLSHLQQNKRDLFSGISENCQGPVRVLHNATPRFLGNMGMKLGFAQESCLPGSLVFARSIHSVGPKEFEKGMFNSPLDREKSSGVFEGSNQRLDDINRGQPLVEPRRPTGLSESLTRRFADTDNPRFPNEMGRDGRPFLRGFNQGMGEINRGQPLFEPGRTGSYDSLTRKFADTDNTGFPSDTGRDGRPFPRGFGSSETGRNMNFVRGIMKDNENYRSGLEQNADIVHIKIMRNNTFVTVTDSKGNKKMGASAGCLAEMKGGPKVSKYSAEATAEHVGRLAKGMGLKSVVMKVNGFTFFKKKKLAILSFRDGYTNSRSDKNPIVYLEDTTRKPHNGCRRKKQRRV